MLRKDNGVTLIQLLVAVIVVIIIAGFAIWDAGNTTTETKLTKLYNEVMLVKNACSEAVTLNQLNPEEYPIKELFTKKVTRAWMDENYSEIGFSSTQEDISDLYIIDKENAGNLETEKITGTYVYDMKNDELYVFGGFTRNGEDTPVYEHKEIERLYKGTLE